MVKKNKLLVKGLEILTSKIDDRDYISLTDIARYKSTETGLVISHWLSTRFTVEFMGAWEQVSNSNFNVTEFRNIKNQSGANGFVLTVTQWATKTQAIGIFAKPGRYNSGTFAHKDIAFEFASWISPEFKLYLIKEFQRLKNIENERLRLGWNIKRALAAVNYRIHTDAIKDNLIPAKISIHIQNQIYAHEADILNLALFGLTAAEWKKKNPTKEGNLRDYASVEQLVVLTNLESLNAVLINQKITQRERLVELNDVAIKQMTSLIRSTGIKNLSSK